MLIDRITPERISDVRAERGGISYNEARLIAERELAETILRTELTLSPELRDVLIWLVRSK